MARNHLAIVRKRLQEYADRGVFNSFSEGATRSGRTEFHLTWLHEQPFTLVYDERASALRFKNFLPHVGSNSLVYASVKAFVQGRTSKTLPAHRRVDSKRAEAKCTLRNQSVTLTLQVKNNQYSYGVKRLVNLVHEIFVLLNGDFIEYLYEHFDLPEE